MSWHTGRLAAFDIETTGTEPESDRIVTAAISLGHGVVPLLDRVGGPEGMLVIDPYVLDKQFDRFRKGKRTLHAVCRHYRVPFDEAHVANADALAAARVAHRLASIVPELRDVDLRDLHRRRLPGPRSRPRCWRSTSEGRGAPSKSRGPGRSCRSMPRAWPNVDAVHRADRKLEFGPEIGPETSISEPT